MRREKNFLKNDNLFIYVGAVIFILFAIVLGIIMYMTTRNEIKIEDGQISEQQSNPQTTEQVTTEIGKSVEEQEKTIESEEKNEEEKSEEKKIDNEKNTTEEIKTETNNNTNAPAEEKSIEVKKEVTFVKPVEGEIICGYAKDNLIYSETLKEWITHTAVDIKAEKTSVIKSAADGVIKTIVNDPRYGLTVVVSHDEGYETVYSNLLTAEFVVEGEEITQGQTIGTVGNTAAFESSMEYHLHFELLKDGEYLDPTIYFK